MRKITAFFICSMLVSGLYAELSDPTRPESIYTIEEPGLSTTDTLTLTAIIVSNATYKAIINGVEVKVGDAILNYKVVQIKENLVILANNDNEITLTLIENNLKSESK